MKLVPPKIVKYHFYVAEYVLQKDGQKKKKK